MHAAGNAIFNCRAMEAQLIGRAGEQLLAALSVQVVFAFSQTYRHTTDKLVQEIVLLVALNLRFGVQNIADPCFALWRCQLAARSLPRHEKPTLWV